MNKATETHMFVINVVNTVSIASCAFKLFYHRAVVPAGPRGCTRGPGPARLDPRPWAHEVGPEALGPQGFEPDASRHMLSFLTKLFYSKKNKHAKNVVFVH